ncbi:hypothetical protein LPJ61_005228, partial [Coemansia biformis]
DYSLYAVLVHAGGSSRSGHYYCYVKSPAGIWHELNDSTVRQVSERTVLQQPAYVLFYERNASSSAERSTNGHGKHRPQSSQVRAQQTAPEKVPVKAEPTTNGKHAVHQGLASVAAASDEMEASLAVQKMSLSDGLSKKKKKRNRREGAADGVRADNSITGNGAATEGSAQVSQAAPAGALAASPDRPAAPADVAPEPLEWVVRDKPVPSDPSVSSDPPACSNKRTDGSAPVVAWNEDAASKRAKSTAAAEARAVAVASGAGQWSVSDVSTSRASQYGAQVESWAGSIAATGSGHDKAKKRQRNPDKYDAEYDRGRIKKVKKNKHNRFAATANPFQAHAERRSGKQKP